MSDAKNDAKYNFSKKRFFLFSLCFTVAWVIFFIHDIARPYFHKHYRASHNPSRVENLMYIDKEIGLFLKSYRSDMEQGVIHMSFQNSPFEIQIISALLTDKYILARTDNRWLIINKTITKNYEDKIETFASELEWQRKLKEYKIENVQLLSREELFATLPNLPEAHEIVLRDLPINLTIFMPFYLMFCLVYGICWWTYVLIISLRDKPRPPDATAS